MATRDDLQTSPSPTQCNDSLDEAPLQNATVLSDQFYLDRLSTVSKSRKPSPIWDLFSVEARPGMLSMLAGKPNPATFPFEHITLGIKVPADPLTPTANSTTELVLRDEDLVTALQYNMTAGIPELVTWVTNLMDEVHFMGSPKSSGWRVSLGHGSQDLLYKAFCALLNPGDTIIVEGPTYPTIIPLLDAMGCHYAIVDSDEEGINASNLDLMLSTWEDHESTKERPFPKVLYTVPFGSNPAGITTSYARRMEILKLVRQYDLFIIEDDPYYFLYYGDTPRPPSYFSLDRQQGDSCCSGGRVVRLDSFSKIISAGFRLGWVTGPNVILTVIERYNATTVVQPSSLSQMVLLKLLRMWGMEGFMEHTERTAAFYNQRRDVMVECLRRHFVTGEVKWRAPDASMFFWIQLNVKGDVSAKRDSTLFVRDSAVPRGVLVLPGATAFPDGRRTECVRISFSLLSDSEMDEAVRRLKEAVVLGEPRDMVGSKDAVGMPSPKPSALDTLLEEEKAQERNAALKVESKMRIKPAASRISLKKCLSNASFNFLGSVFKVNSPMPTTKTKPDASAKR